jgi:HK97 family phage prohead protease
MSVKRELEALDARLAVVQLGIASAQIAGMQNRLAEQAKGEEVVGMLDARIEGKAMAAGGGLRIKGQAGGTGLDRSGEAFLPGVLDQALVKYFHANPILCFHHHTDQALGVVENARVDDTGRLYIEARLDDPEPGTPLADVYNKVKSGTIKGLSVGGIFKRKMTPQGPRIYAAEIVEISVTPVPMEPGSLFTLSGKAVGPSEAKKRQALGELSDLIDTLAEAAGV